MPSADLVAGYNMIVALTENTINAQLLKLYHTKNNPSDPDYIIHHTLDAPISPGSTWPGITSTVSPPTVSFNSAESHCRNLIFTLTRG